MSGRFKQAYRSRTRFAARLSGTQTRPGPPRQITQKGPPPTWENRHAGEVPDGGPGKTPEPAPASRARPPGSGQ
jgi:hypothetical protein